MKATKKLKVKGERRKQKAESHNPETSTLSSTPRPDDATTNDRKPFF
jgi:hypothetical protein